MCYSPQAQALSITQEETGQVTPPDLRCPWPEGLRPPPEGGFQELKNGEVPEPGRGLGGC